MKKKLLKPIKILGEGIAVLLVVLILFVAAATFFSAREAPFGWRVFVVQSGSMEPALRVGGLVLTKPESAYEAGEVVTFLSKPSATLRDPAGTITHRIAAVSEQDGEVLYKTKGDANQGADNEPVAAAQVLGKVVFSLPYLGYVVGFTRTQTGFIILILVPAILIVFGELVNIWKEVEKMAEKRKTVQRTEAK